MFENLHQVSEIELSYKSKFPASTRPRVLTSRQAYEVLMSSWDDNKISFVEQAKVLLLNRANRVLGIHEVSSGGVAGTVVDPKLVFIAAIKANASSILLAHNHPSGNLKPSTQDELLTERLRQCGKFLDIHLHDHIIVSTEGYYSFADERSFDVFSYGY